jgi:uroporphyrinogen decarboxylase
MKEKIQDKMLELTSLEKVIRGLAGDGVPIWLMRQAGRYLEEYRKVRSTTSSFMEFCYNPEKAAEVTMQPIRRFDFDASIIFSDILVIPDALGVDVSFTVGEGPKLEKISAGDLDNLKYNPETLLKVYEAIKLVRDALPSEKSLIGFAGSPWTLSTYMVEGGGSKDFHAVKSWAYADQKSFSKLIYILADSVVEHACAQIEAGVNVFQLFDSWAGTVAAGDEFNKWVIEPTAYIVSKIKEKHPNTPIIGFPRGAGVAYKDYATQTGVDAISVDYNMPMEWIATNIDIAVQGNLDPVLLKNNNEQALVQASKILNIMRGRKFIFNLGHGILPETPIENVHALVDLVKGFRH